MVQRIRSTMDYQMKRVRICTGCKPWYSCTAAFHVTIDEMSPLIKKNKFKNCIVMVFSCSNEWKDWAKITFRVPDNFSWHRDSKMTELKVSAYTPKMQHAPAWPLQREVDVFKLSGEKSQQHWSQLGFNYLRRKKVPDKKRNDMIFTNSCGEVSSPGTSCVYWLFNSKCGRLTSLLAWQSTRVRN